MTVDERDRVVPLTTRASRPSFRSWRRWVAAAGVAAVIAGVGWLVFFSSVLGLRTVRVEGAHQISSAQVVAAAHIPPGTPLARIDLGAVRSRVEAIPSVASATVSRSWPHTLLVRITERQPIAVVHRGGAWWEMDQTAKLFAKAGPRAADQPIVELKGHAGPETLRAVASVLGTLPHPLLVQTRRVTAASLDSITLVLKNASLVRWGDARDSVEKASVLDALLHHKAHVYDVSIPSQPATSR
jgi:cell division protein FtsQ